MPTGYTYKVVNGEMADFSEFALNCARAFGALITMRDDPADAPIPEEIKPECSYNEKRLAESKARLAELNAMTPDEMLSACEHAYATALASHDKYEADAAEEDRRLDAMLEKVDAWTPPTANHVEMKKFMIDQLTISKRGSYRSPMPEMLSPSEWHEAEVKKAMKDVSYHAGEVATEIERAKGRTEWIRALRSSLPSPSREGQS